MTNQKPLLNNKKRDDVLNSAEIMGGPEFEAAPGWGYKVNMWLRKYFNKVILPGIAVLILVLGINNYVSRNPGLSIELDEVGTTGIVKYEDETAKEDDQEPVQDEVIKTDSGSVLEIVQVTEKGEGITHLARKSVKRYLELNPVNLSAEQKIYVEDYLKDKVGSQGLEVGDAVKFSTSDINAGVQEALALNSAQIQNLSQYVPLVNF